MSPAKKYSLHWTTPIYLKAIRGHRESYLVDMLGKQLIVYPGVLSPLYDWSGKFHIENLPDVRGKDFLEIGCGCGLISLFAHFNGAKSVTAVDINPTAVGNTKENFRRHNATNCLAAVSDVFSSVIGRYDIILFNAPYHGAKPADDLEMAVTDEGYKNLRTFLSQATRYLRPSGQIILGFSESGDIELLQKLLKKNSLQITKKISQTKQDYNCQIFYLKSITPDNLG